MREDVFLRKPRFGEIVRTWGEKTLLDYYSQGFENLHIPSEDILLAVEKETSAILGDDLGSKTRERIVTDKWVNTADHHGVLHHPYFYSTALALSHESIRKNNEVTVTLPFGGVSLGNDSFPRGFSFHDREGELHKVFLKSLAQRRVPVYALSSILKEALQHEKERMHSLGLSRQADEKLRTFFDALLSDERVWNQDTYSAQLTAMNAVLWRKLFGDERGDFVYLELESVARRLLLDKHLLQETEVFNLLFNKEWNDTFVELFEDVTGSHGEHHGTHFFWYVDHEEKTRKRLELQNHTLVTTDGSVTIALVPEVIADGLIKRTLVPSSALALIIVHAVEKLACGGGSSQLEYIHTLMSQWTQLLHRFGHSSAVPNLDIWCGHNTSFKITSLPLHVDTPATLIDILLSATSPITTVDNALVTTSIIDAVDTMIPTMRSLYSREPIDSSVVLPAVSL